MNKKTLAMPKFKNESEEADWWASAAEQEEQCADRDSFTGSRYRTGPQAG